MKTLIPGPCSITEKDAIGHAFYKDMEVDILARTLWGEARSEGANGMQAVANVVLNRVRHALEKGGFWWGNNIIQVCQKPYQFSCWNKTDPNFKKLAAVTDRDLNFAGALRVARRAVYTELEDLTYGADHYHADYILPYWAKGQYPVAIIGHHVFYKLER